MFPSLAALETYVAETNFAAWKQENVDLFPVLLEQQLCSQLQSQFIIMRMRDPLFSETMFPRLATGAAKHFVCFPLI